jgi:hypothetical protein
MDVTTIMQDATGSRMPSLPSPPPLPSCGFQVIPFAVKFPPSSTTTRFGPNGDTMAASLVVVSNLGDDDTNNDKDDYDHGGTMTTMMMAIVGTIVMMGQRSAMIHVGWGHASYSTLPLPEQQQQQQQQQEEEQLSGCTTKEAAAATATTATSSCGTGAPTMGPLVLAMPRTKYQGMEKTRREPACSSLIGSSDDDQLLAYQMASRLSLQLGMAILVSCQLSTTSPSLVSSLLLLSSLSISSSTKNNKNDNNNNNDNKNDMDSTSWTSGVDSSADGMMMISHQAAALAEKEIRTILVQQQQQQQQQQQDNEK